MSSFDAHLLYGLCWFAFAALHSVLATLGARTALGPALGRAYRLVYNGVAVITLVPVWIAGQILLGSGLDFNWPPLMQGVLFALFLTGGGLMILALREYDLGLFSGMAQFRQGRGATLVAEEEPLHFDGLHRYVRHPIYSAGFLILWGRVSDEFSLATAFWASLYLVIGSRFEERRLIRL
ncbi:MAG: methyltransferase family protein, partial [Magnetospiraceae bacterium]